MRFIPTFCLRENMILAKNLYAINGQFMLVQNTILTQKNIDSIIRLGYNGIYINDNLSADIEVISIISDDLRTNTIKNIQSMFMTSEKNNKFDSSKLENIMKQIEDIIDNLLNTEHLMINMIDLKVFDNYTYYHSVNVVVLALVIGISLKYDKKQLFQLGLGALLHDIGKVFVKKEILNKPGKLTSEEFDEMKKHSEIGYNYMKKEYIIPLRSSIAALDHHEKFNGSGYPNSKIGFDISEYGRVIAICDVYDALISDRPYRKGMLPSEAMEYVMGGSGTMFDPAIVKVFTMKVAPYPVGTCVLLSNGCTGIVVENFEDCCLRPKVRIFHYNGEQVEPYIINLMTDKSFTNVTIIDISKV